MSDSAEQTAADGDPAERPEFDGRRPEKLLAALRASPAIQAALLPLGATLMDTMEPRTRELVALRVSALRDSAYLWSGHVPIAMHLGALDPDEIARVAVGSAAFEERDAAVLLTVEHVLANRAVDALARRLLSEPDILAITVATGFYATIASVMQGAEPEPDLPEIAGIETPAEARGTAAGPAAADRASGRDVRHPKPPM